MPLAAALIAAVIMFFLGGCIPDITCVDIGCPAGQTCNQQTLTCEVPVRECTITGCPAGQRCDEQNQICRPEAVSCRNQSCGRNQTCNTQTGFCETNADCTTNGCSSDAETCDAISGLCIAVACSSDSGCSGGFICGDNLRCIAGCRSDGRACKQGQYCRVQPGDTFGQCMPQCILDTDCPFGQRCELQNERAVCQLEDTCESDDNCRADEVCVDAVCTQPPCASNNDCPNAQVCNRSTGNCLEFICNEDIFAPNHTAATAAPLAPGTYSQLTLCPEDWFSIDVRSNDAVRFRINHSDDSDIDAYLFDADGNLLTANQRLNSAIYLDYVTTRAQRLRLQLISTNYTSANYRISLSLNEDRFCTDDDFEENDTLEEATRLPTTTGTRSELPLRICGYDQDWFVLPELSADQGLRIRFRNAPRDFIGSLLTPDGAVFRPSIDEDVLLTRLGKPGDYYLHARSKTGQSTNYRMLFEVLPRWQCNAASTAHTTRNTAQPLASDTTQTQALCPADASWALHWFALETPPEPTSTIHVELRPNDHGPHAPALNLTLFEIIHDQPVVVRAAAAQLDGTMKLQSEVTGDNPLYLRISSPDAVQRVYSPPGYQISYTWNQQPNISLPDGE